jgi:hypothetical protein
MLSKHLTAPAGILAKSSVLEATLLPAAIFEEEGISVLDPTSLFRGKEERGDREDWEPAR